MLLFFYFYLSPLSSLQNEYRSVNGNIKSIKIKYITPSYKKAKIVFEKINSEYEIKMEGKRIVEEAEKKNGEEIVNYRKYSYITTPQGISAYCSQKIDEERKSEEKSIEYLCERYIKKISEIKIEKIKDGTAFKTYFLIKKEKSDDVLIYDMDDNFMEKEIYNYGEQGELKEKITYNDLGDMIYRVSYESPSKLLRYIKTYNSNNNIIDIMKEERRIDGTLRKKIFTKYTFSGNLDSRVETFYNERGIKEEEKYYDSNEMIYKNYVFEYETDEKGNWIKEFKYLKKEGNKKFLETIVVREIVY